MSTSQTPSSSSGGRPPFRRSRRHRLVAGVCGGVAEWLGWNVILVRILWTVITVIPVLPGLPLYLILWLVLPRAEDTRHSMPTGA